MSNKTEKNFEKTKSALIKGGIVAGGIAVIITAYLKGRAVGLSVAPRILKKYEPELYEEVSCVMTDYYLGNYK